MSFILPVTGTGASGQVQDLQGHHRDDQEQLLDQSRRCHDLLYNALLYNDLLYNDLLYKDLQCRRCLAVPVRAETGLNQDLG